MAKTVQLDDEIYEFLRQQCDFEETLSDVLRRLLSFPARSNDGVPAPALGAIQTVDCPTCGKTSEVAKTHQIGGRTVPTLKCGHIIFPERTPEKRRLEEDSFLDGRDGVSDNAGRANGAGGSENALLRFVANPALLCRNTTERYLAILGFAFKEKQTEFAKVLEVSGRRRKYFAGSRKEIEASGTSTHPHPIPGSHYWAMTNADTIQKREMLSKALHVLEYSSEEIQAVTAAIR